MYRLVNRCLVLLLMLGATLGAEAQGVKAENQQRLIVMGASYAAGWKEPALPGFSVTNKGVGGEDTTQVRARFERDVLAAKPHTVLLWGHINNVHRAGGNMPAAIERVKADYVAMIEAARGAGIEVIIGTEVTMSEAVGLVNRAVAFVNRLRGNRGYSAGVNEQVRVLNEWLRSYARGQGLRVLDFERVFDDGEGFRKLEYSQEDGSHITQAGYDALTRYARGELAKG